MVNTSVLILKSGMSSFAEAAYAEDVKVMAKTEKVTIAVMNHFLN